MNGNDMNSAWKVFRPTGGMTTDCLSQSTKALAAKYLGGEIGRSMTDCPSRPQLVGYHEWNSDWLIAGPILNNVEAPSAGDLLLDNAKTMEEVKQSTNVLLENVRSDHGKINFKKIFSSENVCTAAYCFTEIDTSFAGILPIAVSCDWWYSVFVNGQLVSKGSGYVYNLMDIPLAARSKSHRFSYYGGDWRMDAFSGKRRMLRFAGRKKTGS